MSRLGVGGGCLPPRSRRIAVHDFCTGACASGQPCRRARTTHVDGNAGAWRQGGCRVPAVRLDGRVLWFGRDFAVGRQVVVRLFWCRPARFGLCEWVLCSTRCPLRELGSEWRTISACLIWRRPGVGIWNFVFSWIHGFLLVFTVYVLPALHRSAGACFDTQ